MAKTTTTFPVSSEGIYAPPGPGESHPRVIGMPVAIWYNKNSRGIVKQTHVACMSTVQVNGVDWNILAVSFAKTAGVDIRAHKACKADGRTMASVRLSKAIKQGFVDADGMPIVHSMVGLWVVEKIDDEIHLKPLVEPTSRFTQHFADGELVDPSDVQYMKHMGVKMKRVPTQRRSWVEMPEEHRLKAVARRLGR